MAERYASNFEPLPDVPAGTAPALVARYPSMFKK